VFVGCPGFSRRGIVVVWPVYGVGADYPVGHELLPGCTRGIAVPGRRVALDRRARFYISDLGVFHIVSGGHQPGDFAIQVPVCGPCGRISGSSRSPMVRLRSRGVGKLRASDVISPMVG